MKKYIGIDLGGTKVRVAKVDEKGNIIKDIIMPSCSKEGADAILNNIISILKQHDLSDVEGIGFAVPGPVDEKTNTISMATNIPGCEGYPFADKLEKEFGLKVILDNDANAAGLAESLLGAGVGYKTVFYLTHSTGIGGALIIDGKIHSGHRGYAGEIANVIVDPNAKEYPIYSHLNKGGVETVASGTALGLIAKEKLGEEIDTSGKMFDLVSKGNKIAIEIVDKMCDDLARCLSAVSAIIAPDCIVIGGGVSNASNLYLDKLKEYFKKYAHKGMRDIPIKIAELKEPGVVGAAMLVKAKEQE